MRTGIGLPAAVPDTDMSGIGDWAAEAERAGLASVVRLSGGRLTAGLGMEGWPADYGWVAPLFGHAVLADGAEALAGAWRDCDRGDSPRIVTGRYFSLGADAEHVADEYIRPYYGADYYALARADTLTEPDQIGAELDRLEQAGCDDVLLFPCSGDPEQVSLLAAAREFAGDRLVDVAAGQIGSQALELGLIDEVVINQVPVVCGAGRPFFATGELDEQLRLENPTTIVQGDRVTHLVYDVR